MTAKWSRTAGDSPAATDATWLRPFSTRLAAQDDHRRCVLGNSGCPRPGHLDRPGRRRSSGTTGRPPPIRSPPRRTAGGRHRQSRRHRTAPTGSGRPAGPVRPGPPASVMRVGLVPVARAVRRWPALGVATARGCSRPAGSQQRPGWRRPPAGDGRRTRRSGSPAARPPVAGEEVIAARAWRRPVPSGSGAAAGRAAVGWRRRPEQHRSDRQAALVDQVGGRQVAEQARAALAVDAVEAGYSQCRDCLRKDSPDRGPQMIT